ncbi:MAG TPA: tryptophan 2,3-dioxygenase family protein [Candidatus Obscuribacterales bacterium]
MTSSRNMGQPTQDKNQPKKGSYTPAPGALTYNAYLKVNELKQLQICQSDPAHHDEPLFIIIHQAYELWFKLILHELDEVFAMMAAQRVRKATFFMRRVNEIMKLLAHQIHILETMSPRDFLGFRYNLSPASGFGSSQFREIEFMSGLRYPELLEHFSGDPSYETLKKRMEQPSLGEAFYTLLAKKGFKLAEAGESAGEAEIEQAQNKRVQEIAKLYTDEETYGDLHDLAEAFVEFDELLFLWRANHVIVVERMIGFKRGTGGSEGVGYLQTTLSKRCFPDLWKVRTVLEQPEGGAGPQSQSPPGKGGGCPFH